MPLDISKDPIMQKIAAGRTFDEQVQYIRKYASHAAPGGLRERLLDTVGIRKPQEKAENVLIFGCYVPFRIPSELKDSLDLLSQLGIEYTFLDDEYCCALPLIETTKGKERQQAEEAAEEFLGLNISQARERGAKRVVYCCVWCAYLAKRFYGNCDLEQIYYYDLIAESLEKATLRLNPTVVGYYEGCHRRNRAWAPGISLDWPRYRKILGRIQGLEIVDLPHRTCCVFNSQRIIKEAEQHKVGAIVCSCVACHTRIRAASKGKISVKYLPEVLLGALQTR